MYPLRIKAHTSGAYLLSSQSQRNSNIVGYFSIDLLRSLSINCGMQGVISCTDSILFHPLGHIYYSLPAVKIKRNFSNSPKHPEGMQGLLGGFFADFLLLLHLSHLDPFIAPNRLLVQPIDRLLPLRERGITT